MQAQSKMRECRNVRIVEEENTNKQQHEQEEAILFGKQLTMQGCQRGAKKKAGRSTTGQDCLYYIIRSEYGGNYSMVIIIPPSSCQSLLGASYCTVPKLEQKWQAAELKKAIYRLEIRVEGRSNTDLIALSKIIFRVFPKLEFARVIFGCSFKPFKDSELVGFLRHLPHSIRELMLSGLSGDMPLILQEIGSFSVLEYVHLYYSSTGWCCPSSFEVLADSLEQLHILKQVSIIDVVMLNPKDCLEPLACVIGSMQECGRIICLDLNCREYVATNMFRPYRMDTELQNIFSKGPTFLQKLKQLKHKNDLSIPENNVFDGDLVSWVEAIIKLCREGLDYTYFLLSQLPPHAFSRS